MHEIPGVYVNARAQLLLLVRHTDTAIEVLRSNDTVGMATVTVKTAVSLNGAEGLYNGIDTIQWNNNDTWRRVEMSILQFRLLTRRPYIPLTFVAMGVFQDAVRRGFAALFATVIWMKLR